MKLSERDDLIKATHQALLGLDGTEDKGLVGDFKELKKDFKEANGRQRKTDKRLNILIGTLIGLGIIGGGSAGISQLLN